MAKATFKPKKYDEPSVDKPKAHYPSAFLPASSEQLKGLEIGMNVEVTLRGTVNRLSAGEEHSDFDMDIHSSEVYPAKEDKTGADEMDDDRPGSIM